MPLLLADRAATSSPLPLMTAAEAEVLGIRPSGPHWHRVRPGVYTDAVAYGRLAPWQRYAVRVHAFLRTHPEAVVCLESAAVAHGLPLFGETRDIHVLGARGEKARRFGDVQVHAGGDERTIEVIDGIRVTSALDTAIDLSRALPPAKALALADSAVSITQGGTVDLYEARAKSQARQDRRGCVRGRWVWARADPLAESPPESVSRAVIEWSGFEMPELQRVFRYEGHQDRADFYFPSCRAIGESDGWQKYRLDSPENAATLLAEEKRREDRLRRNGHPFARWELRDALRVTPLQRALHTAGVRRVRPPQPAMLATLAQSPRELPPRR